MNNILEKYRDAVEEYAILCMIRTKKKKRCSWLLMECKFLFGLTYLNQMFLEDVFFPKNSLIIKKLIALFSQSWNKKFCFWMRLKMRIMDKNNTNYKNLPCMG